MSIRAKIKKLYYKIKYGSQLKIKSIDFEKNSSLKIVGKNGTIIIGENFRLKSNSFVSTVGGNIEIGDYCFFNRNCNLVSRQKVHIGNMVSFGPNVSVFDHDHKFDSQKVYDMDYKTGDIEIGDGCWIGAGAVILRNTHIGEGSVIGAGTVVKGDIPPHSIVTTDRSLKIRQIIDKDNKTED